MKNDEERPSPEAASEEFFPAVEPEAQQYMLALRGDGSFAGAGPKTGDYDLALRSSSPRMIASAISFFDLRR